MPAVLLFLGVEDRDKTLFPIICIIGHFVYIGLVVSVMLFWCCVKYWLGSHMKSDGNPYETSIYLKRTTTRYGLMSRTSSNYLCDSSNLKQKQQAFCTMQCDALVVHMI